MGHRWGALTALIHVERNHWLGTEFVDKLNSGVLDVAVGGQVHSGGDFVRSSAMVGFSRLTFDTFFHQKGQTGVFFEIRPIELCWSPLEWLGITLAPITFDWVAPALGDPTLRLIQYRSVAGVEFRI